MSPEQLFSLCGALVMPGWLLLVLLPRWKWTARLVCPVLIPLPLALVYLWLVATTFGRTPGDFGSLAGVSQLFQSPRVLLAGWIHYLAFDLFVGTWIARSGLDAGLSPLLILPCLVLTFLVGPVGLLLALLIRLSTGTLSREARP